MQAALVEGLPQGWPADVKIPKGLTKYKRSDYTQSIFNRNVIPVRVHRSKLEEKWHQSGGLEGIIDFKSTLFKFVPGSTNDRVDEIKVDQVLTKGGIQYELGWKRDYPDGTFFFDVLTKNGKIFELRERTKVNGKWKSRVAFKDEKQRPLGYNGLLESCSNCHDQAGTGSYAAGLIPGADTVISDPFEGLER